MAVMRAARTGKTYFRLLPLVSAFVLLAGLSTPAPVFAQSAEQTHLDESNDRQDAERARVLQEQDNKNAINDAESENAIRQHQNDLDDHLQEQEQDSQLDSERRAAQDRADYLRNIDSSRAAALAKEAHEAAKKDTTPATKTAKTIPDPAPTPAPTTPKQDLTPTSDSIIGAPSMANMPPQPATPQSTADAMIAAPATKTPSGLTPTEEGAIDKAVSDAIAQAQFDAAKDAPVPAAAAKPTASKEIAKTPEKVVVSDDKTPPPPMVQPKVTAVSKKVKDVTEALKAYDDEVQSELADGLPSRSINDMSLIDDDSKNNPIISLNSIVLFALDDNPDVGMAQARKDQAIHNVGRAKAALYPHMDLTLEQNEEYNSPAAGKQPAGPYFNPSNRAFVTLQQLIYDGDITNNTIKQREQAVTGADFDIESNTKDVLSTTVQQYLNVLKFQSTLRDNQEFIARLKNIEGIIQTTYQMGGSAKNDVEYAESRMAAAESGLENVRSSLNDSVSNLQSLTGPLPDFKASAPDELDPERVKLDEYVKLAQQFNNDVLANENDLQSLRYKLKSDKGAYMPRVNVIMTGERTYDDGGPTGRDLNGKATVQLSYNIFDGFEKRETIKRTQAMISEVEIKRRKIMDDLRKQLRLAYNQMSSLQKNISKTKAEISSSQTLQDLNRQNFEQGTVSLIELIEGEERLNNARAKLHQQESDLYLSAYKLLLQVGVMKKNFFCDQC